jgi:spermidine synthase
MESLDHAALGLRHGATMHGFQVKHLPLSPTAYYIPQSGIGRLLSQHPRRDSADPSLRVGVIGLGVGTLAAYSRPGDYYRFYEINPLVAEYSSGAQPKFTFLKNARGSVDIVLGDARLSLEHEAELGNLQRFDVLVLDAFSSDAIPVHLLTKEAMEVYLKHLRAPESIVAVHITNKTLDLRPVVLGLCRQFGLASVLVSTYDNYASEWVLLSREARALALPQLQVAGKPMGGRKLLWTDDFSNLYQVVRH